MTWGLEFDQQRRHSIGGGAALVAGSRVFGGSGCVVPRDLAGGDPELGGL